MSVTAHDDVRRIEDPSEVEPAPRFAADVSLALINRTGAYHICRELLDSLPNYLVATRYWRAWREREPRGLLRKLLARSMLFEIDHLALVQRVLPQRGSARSGTPTLFMDPLYVLGTRLGDRDVVLCHDVGPVTHPQLFDRRTTENYRTAYRMIQEARPGVVFVSEASRNEFVSLYGDDFRFLEVIPLFVRPQAAAGAATAPPGIEPPFLLTVGALELRKNHARTIRAFAESGLAERGYRYVVCGPRGNSAAEVERAALETPGVQVLGYLGDAELRWLYRHARGFVLPSLLEGFGLPALEAAQHGLVSLVSVEGAQREAVGEGAILVDPASVPAIAAGMRRLADMPEDERGKRLALARGHAAALSRDRFVRSWADLLEAAARGVGSRLP